jgi:hypothetical protein
MRVFPSQGGEERVLDLCSGSGRFSFDEHGLLCACVRMYVCEGVGNELTSAQSVDVLCTCNTDVSGALGVAEARSWKLKRRL